VRGSIAPNSTPVSFLAVDTTGAPMPAGIPVSFVLSPSASNNVVLSPAYGVTDAQGMATTILFAGGQAENVTVSASASKGGITATATSPTIAIVSGIPEYSHLSWGCKLEDFTVNGMYTDGVTQSCTLQVADRFSDQVDTGTQVNFRVEAGNVNATSIVDMGGAAQATIRSGDPRPTHYTVAYGPSGLPGITGIIKTPSVSASYPRIPHRPFPFGTEDIIAGHPQWLMQNVQAIAGVTLIGMTQGEESFVDTNQNDVYDQGEPFLDLAEPFIDKNENGVQDECMVDAGGGAKAPFTNYPPYNTLSTFAKSQLYYECYEDYIDLNGNGVWDAGNNQWDNYTTIWRAITPRWNDHVSVDLYPPSVNPLSAQLLDDVTGLPALGPTGPSGPADYGVLVRTPVNLGSGGLFPSFTTYSFNLDILDEDLICDLYGQTFTITPSLTGIDGVAIDVVGTDCTRTIILSDTATTPRTASGPSGTTGTANGTLKVIVHTNDDNVDHSPGGWPVTLGLAPSPG
jgi:hypothetical protein